MKGTDLTMGAASVRQRLRALADPQRAKTSAWFFKSAPGEYGHGDRFLGIRVPDQRRVARAYRELPLAEVVALLKSPFHEERFTALEILVAQYERGTAAQRERVFRCYLRHTRYINNWDLVDTSARYIVGEHLRDRDRRLLLRLARSKSLWERRIAMVATQGWIAAGETREAYQVADLLLEDSNDLIHKAVGWMLRECGVQSRAELVAFLRKHYQRLPRTTLRYAIEHMPAAERKRMLAGVFSP